MASGEEALDLPIVALPFDQFVIQKTTNAIFTFIDLAGQDGNLSLAKSSFHSDFPAIKRKAKRLLSKMGLRL